MSFELHRDGKEVDARETKSTQVSSSDARRREKERVCRTEAAAAGARCTREVYYSDVGSGARGAMQ